MLQLGERFREGRGVAAGVREADVFLQQGLAEWVAVEFGIKDADFAKGLPVGCEEALDGGAAGFVGARMKHQLWASIGVWPTHGRGTQRSNVAAWPQEAPAASVRFQTIAFSMRNRLPLEEMRMPA